MYQEADCHMSQSSRVSELNNWGSGPHTVMWFISDVPCNWYFPLLRNPFAMIYANDLMHWHVIHWWCSTACDLIHLACNSIIMVHACDFNHWCCDSLIYIPCFWSHPFGLWSQKKPEQLSLAQEGRHIPSLTKECCPSPSGVTEAKMEETWCIWTSPRTFGEDWGLVFPSRLGVEGSDADQTDPFTYVTPR